MVRRKAQNRVPPITPTRRAGRAWDSTFLGQQTPQEPPQRPWGDATILSQISRANTTPDVIEDILLAQEGYDRDLLPYQPTPTINPGRPRTLAAGYDDRTQTLRIKFREGEIYEYYNVPPSVWWKFQRAQSPGRYINTVLNKHPYKRGL